jgi:hypothetical protein
MIGPSLFAVRTSDQRRECLLASFGQPRIPFARLRLGRGKRGDVKTNGRGKTAPFGHWEDGSERHCESRNKRSNR